MADVTVQKRGEVYQYKFEIASIDGKRKFKNKSGFATNSEAKPALNLYSRINSLVGKSPIPLLDKTVY